MSVEIEVLKGTVASLEQEKGFLVDKLTRTEVELQRLQQQREKGAPPPPLSEAEEEALGAAAAAPRPPWLTSTEYLSPLLRAYDERVAELLAAVGSLQSELADAESKADGLVAENEQLHADLAQKRVHNKPMRTPHRSPKEIFGCISADNSCLTLSNQNTLHTRKHGKHGPLISAEPCFHVEVRKRSTTRINDRCHNRCF